MKRICLFILNFSMCILTTIGQNAKDSNFFPLAVWLQNANNAKQYHQDGGINMYIGLWESLDEKQFNQLKSAGVKLICEQNDFALAHKSDAVIYGWMHGDEPDNAQWNETSQKYDPCIPPHEIISYYNTVKQKDPHHPYYLNLGQGVSYTNWIGRGECTGRTDLYPQYLMGCDIASFDIYPVNSNDSIVRDKLWMGAKGIDSLRVWCNDIKPVFTWIETTRIGEDSPRKPTPSEVKTQVWMAIIHGAKGIGYFCHSFYPSSVDAALLHDKEMLAAVKEINNSITRLAAVLNSESKSSFAEVKSSNLKVPIDILAKQYENTNYLFAVAMRNDSTMASFNVRSGKSIEVIGENRAIQIVNGKFEDHFKGYEVHIYKIK